MFVKLGDQLVNSDAIKSISFKRGPSDGYGWPIAVLMDGKTIEGDHCSEMALEALLPTFAVPPGWKAITPSIWWQNGQLEAYFDIRDVIAFRDFGDGYLTPVCWEALGPGHYAMVLPDGRVDIPADRTFDDVETYKKQAIADWKSDHPEPAKATLSRPVP